MTARTTRQLVDDVNRILVASGLRPRLLPAAGRKAVPGRGKGLPAAKAKASASGIASPLTEPNPATRTYYAEAAVASSDGVFTLMIAPLHRIDLQDANAAPVQINYANPAP